MLICGGGERLPEGIGTQGSASTSSTAAAPLDATPHGLEPGVPRHWTALFSGVWEPFEAQSKPG